MTISTIGARETGVGTLFFIGNATVLLRVAGLAILTDPNFVPRGTDVPLGYGLSTTRLTDPAIGMEDLPPLDAVLLSHYHGDHFDELAEERLDRDLPIVTTPQAAGMLESKGFRAAVPLETWVAHEMAGPAGRVRITSLPGRHAPGPLEIALPDVMGSLIEIWTTWPAATSLDAAAESATAPGVEAPAARIYISGDTIVYEDLHQIPEKSGPIDLALLHLGGTRVLGVTVTMDAEQGVELLRILRPSRAAAIHYDDYEAFKSPIEDFVTAVREAGMANSVTVLERGSAIELP
jgi:L-ascorbate metabolism protein UlaG (beta-lactamase superfamily)